MLAVFMASELHLNSSNIKNVLPLKQIQIFHPSLVVKKKIIKLYYLT